MVVPDALHQGRRQTARFRPEQKRIAGPVLDRAVEMAAARFDRKEARPRESSEAAAEVRMNFDGREIVIVESRALQALVVEPEPQRLDQMQRRAGIGAESNGVSGIRRDLGFKQDYVEHRP
jgi:hypothetical protein